MYSKLHFVFNLCFKEFKGMRYVGKSSYGKHFNKKTTIFKNRDCYLIFQDFELIFFRGEH